MSLINKIQATILLVAIALPAWATADSDSDYKAYCELKRKCPSVAVIYVDGDTEEAQKRAKELFPVVERLNGIEHYHTFDNDLNMLKAVMRGDDKAVETYIENDYPAPSLEFLGFKVGLKEALRVHERFLVLIAAKEGPSSTDYFVEGSTVAAMMFAVGREEEAKSLAEKCLPLLKPARDEEEKKKKQGSLSCDFDNEESVLKGIINNDNSAVKTFLRKSSSAGDSIGARLEEAYGKIYLYKRLRMDLVTLHMHITILAWSKQ